MVLPGKHRLANAPNISQIRQTNHHPKAHRGHPSVRLHPALPSQPREPSGACATQLHLSVLRSHESPPSRLCLPVPTSHPTRRLYRGGSSRLESLIEGTDQFFIVATHRQTHPVWKHLRFPPGNPQDLLRISLPLSLARQPPRKRASCWIGSE